MKKNVRCSTRKIRITSYPLLARNRAAMETRLDQLGFWKQFHNFQDLLHFIFLYINYLLPFSNFHFSFFLDFFWFPPWFLQFFHIFFFCFFFSRFFSHFFADFFSWIFLWLFPDFFFLIFPDFFLESFQICSFNFSGIFIYAKSNFKTLWRSKLQYCKCRLDQALNDFVSHFIKARIYWKNNWIFASICSTNQLVIRDRFPSLWNAFEKKITEQQQWPRSSPFKNLRVVSLVKMFLEKYSNLQSK